MYVDLQYFFFLQVSIMFLVSIMLVLYLLTLSRGGNILKFLKIFILKYVFIIREIWGCYTDQLT